MLLFRLSVFFIFFVIIFLVINTDTFQKLWAKIFSKPEDATSIEDDFQAAESKHKAAKANLEKRKKLLEAERQRLNDLNQK